MKSGSQERTSKNSKMQDQKKLKSNKLLLDIREQNKQEIAAGQARGRLNSVGEVKADPKRSGVNMGLELYPKGMSKKQGSDR
jgi:hypothetical protein